MSENRIDATFARLKKEGRKALIGYVTAGYPKKDTTLALIPKLVDAGLDILELGIPFSDPIADGPTIQEASQVALHNGVTLAWALEQTAAIRQKTAIPIVYMSYSNPILAMGVGKFFKAAAAAGVDGLIIPDIIPEESADFAKAAKETNVHLIHLVALSTPPDRLSTIAKATEGFLYAVSLTGVTGARSTISDEVLPFLRRVRNLCRKPLAVGFGISTPDQVRMLQPHVDGIIVGSALINAIRTSTAPEYSQAVEFVRTLKSALSKETSHAS
jgi:tryptophan synthase alpha chain